jgi:hypothetical protein
MSGWTFSACSTGSCLPGGIPFAFAGAATGWYNPADEAFERFE